MRVEMEYIYMAYKMGSFSKAARALYITQPTLSLAVQRVETELGYQIFNRSSRSLTLTEAGEVFIEYINRERDLEQQLRKKLDDISNLKNVQLRIGGTPMHISCLLPRVISRFNALYPNVNITMVSGFPHEQLQMLRDKVIDMALSTEIGGKSEKFYCIPAFNVHYLVAVPPEQPINSFLEEYALCASDIIDKSYLNGNHPCIALSRFSDVPFILLTEGSDFYTRSHQLFSEAKLDPISVMRVSQPAAAYRMAKSGIGATLVGSLSVEGDDALKYYMLDSPLGQRQFYFVLRDESEMTDAQREFIKAFLCGEITDN